MTEQYRGFTIQYRTAQFTVEAIVFNGCHRINSLEAHGNNTDEARRKIRARIDSQLQDGN